MMSKKLALLSLRLTVEEKGRIAQSAAAQGISMSEYLRQGEYLRRGARGSTKMVGGEEPDKPKQAEPEERKRRR